MLLIINIVVQEVVDRLLRLSAAAALRNVARVRGHGHEVKVGGEAVKCRECNVEKEVRIQGICSQQVSCARRVLSDVSRSDLLGRMRNAHLTPTQKSVAANMPARKGV